MLLSLREDSLASLDALRAVIPGILSSPVQLRPLDRTAAEQAIRKPVAKWSEEKFGDVDAVVVEDSLVDTLLDQVRQTGAVGLSAQPSPNAPANLVELPLLQLTLERLWEEEAKADKPVLRAQTLKELGGAAGIARQHLDQILEALPAPRRALAIRLFRHLVTATGGKHAWRADDLAEEIGADTQAARQAAERTIDGRIAARIERVAGAIGAAGRRLFGARQASTEQNAISAAIADTLDKLAAGKARILRTQPDPRGKGPLFELYHDALARPVLSWVQDARIREAEHRQRRRSWAAAGLALLMIAGILVVYTFYHRAVIQQEQAQLQEARAVSTVARQATERGDAMTGLLATRAVLPKDPSKPDRPLSNAASATLLDSWLRNREKCALIGHTDAVTSVVFSPDGKRVVTGSQDHTARVWDLSGATPVTVLEGHGGSVTSVAFSPDGKRVVTGSDDTIARVWDLSGAIPVATVLEGHAGPVRSVAFSPDGKRVVTRSDDRTARVWDLSGPTPVAIVLAGNRGGVTCVAFSPDGKRVVTGSEDGTGTAWDLSGVTPASIELAGQPWARVNSVAFSPDGRRVVTGSSDGTARVWSLSGASLTATELDNLANPNVFDSLGVSHPASINSVAFSPDGKRVVTGSNDNTARVWDRPPALSCSRAIAAVSPA